MHRLLSVALLFSLPALLCGTASAEIWKWTDAAGKTHFSDTPPPHKKARPLVVHDNTINGAAAAAKPAAPSGAPAAAEQRRATPRVVIYTASWCGYCRRARALLRQRQVPFAEYDIETSSQGVRDFARLQGQGVPITLIGNIRLDGFEAGEFAGVLDRAGF